MGLYLRESDDIDVMLLAEGTYPYVKGGVSTWISELIRGLPEFKFGLIFLGSRPEDYSKIGYKFPDNLVHLEVHYLFDKKKRPPVMAVNGDREVFKSIWDLHGGMKFKHNSCIPDMVKKIAFSLKEVDESQFLYSKESWDFITEQYEQFCPEVPFIDYFWMIRNMYAPIWSIAKIAKQLRKAKVIHSPSTGYAGFLGSLIQSTRGTPFILTEHGIYTSERKIDLLNIDWLIDNRTFLQKELAEGNYLKNMWISFFEGIGRICYSASDSIISIYEDARRIQIRQGASPEKTIIIPNGVSIERFKSLRQKRGKEIPKAIGLIGRVVPIKDVKTFVKAMRSVVNHIEDVEGWIVGPEDENPEYVRECKYLVETLNLNKNIKFLKFQEVDDILPYLGLITLTSISEAMPLTILESFASGIPAVTTDVGACRQLIYGGVDEEDIRLGKAGEVVTIADPHTFAEAYLKLLTDKEEWRRSQQVAIERVEKYYTIEKVLESYRKIYMEVIGGRYRL